MASKIHLWMPQSQLLESSTLLQKSEVGHKQFIQFIILTHSIQLFNDQLRNHFELRLTNFKTDIVDKTAGFVAKHGPDFEAMIRQNEINNNKFNFLNQDDPYHGYFRHKVKEITEGKGFVSKFQ